MTFRARAVLMFALAACGDSSPTAPHGTGRVRLVGVGSADTAHFEVPVTARRCADGRGILVTGAQAGQGVLVWLRSTGAALDTGAYPLLTRGDSSGARGAIVAVRYAVGPVTHGLTVDDGVAIVTRTTPALDVAVRGNGLEVPSGGRGGQRTVELAADRVPLGPDPAFCRVQP